MANNDMTWERWISLPQNVKEFERFQFNERLEKRLKALEQGKFKRTMGQLISSFFGGVVFWIALVMFYKDLPKLIGGG